MAVAVATLVPEQAVIEQRRPSASSQPSTNSLDMVTSRAGSVPRTVYGSFPDPPFHNAEGNAQRAISTINIRA